jgi:uncharacterized membrane protein
LKKYTDYILALILFFAGVAHFLIPEAFLVAMPGYIPEPLFNIYATGFLELVFAIFICIPKFKKRTGKWLALYFIILIPVHVHVSLNGIEMFGISNKVLLWLKTLFQGVFIYWALQLGSNSSQDSLDQL